MKRGKRRQRGEECTESELQKIQPCSENNSEIKPRGVCKTTSQKVATDMCQTQKVLIFEKNAV